MTGSSAAPCSISGDRSAKVAAARTAGDFERGQPGGEEVDRATAALETSVDQQRRGLQGDPALTLPDPGRADDVDHASLVLDLHEDDTAGCRGPLTMRDQAADDHCASVLDAA